MPTNPYINGMNLQIPDEYAQDYMNEYEKLSQPDNYDPLLMYILQKNAQNGFKNGPIGSDSYYETFDPEYNEDLYPDFTDFMNTYYPDFDDKLREEEIRAYEDDSGLEYDGFMDNDRIDTDGEIWDKMRRLSSIRNLRDTGKLIPADYLKKW